MSFIQNENFVSVTSRSKCCTFAKVTSIINTVVTGGINFDNVNRTAAIASKFDAARALAARGIGWTLGAVQAASKNACRGGLSATSWA